MQDIDFIDEPDELLAALVAKMEDGGFDDWVNFPTTTVRQYVALKLLEELEDVQRLVLKEDNQVAITKLLNDRILRLVEQCS